MPPEIDRAIRADETPRDLVERITVFGEALTNAVYRRDERLAPPSAKAVLQKYGQSLGLDEDGLRAVLETGVSETRDTFRVMRVALDDLKRFGASVVVALPVVVRGTLVGCMAFDHIQSIAVPEGQTLTLLRRLRDAAAQAMAERRA
jgi:hypothetical protein